MTKNTIITQLYYSREFNECINKMYPEHLRDELKAEVCLVLCGKSEEFLQGLHQRNELKYWVARVMFNMMKSNTSTFYKKFRQPLTEYVENITDGHTTA